jgi:hypothetical protein
MDKSVHHGYSKANAFFKGYKRSRGGYYELWGDYVGIGSNYTIKSFSGVVKPKTFLSELCYLSNSQRLM